MPTKNREIEVKLKDARQISGALFIGIGLSSMIFFYGLNIAASVIDALAVVPASPINYIQRAAFLGMFLSVLLMLFGAGLVYRGLKLKDGFSWRLAI